MIVQTSNLTNFFKNLKTTAFTYLQKKSNKKNRHINLFIKSLFNINFSYIYIKKNKIEAFLKAVLAIIN